MEYERFITAIEALGDGEKNTALEVRTLLLNLIQHIFLPGDIKLVHCTQKDLENDYTSTGLGKGKRSGWAQCNGFNGAPPYGGRVPLGYNDKYSGIGDIGGSKDAVVVEHSHVTKWNMNTGTGVDVGSTLVATNHTVGANIVTEMAGVSGVDKNLQPYIVVLYLMKL